jgi:protein ImuB
MVICVLFSRFALVAALEGRGELMGEPVALAPEAGRRQVVGEVSPAAEAFGVVPGMRTGEALARCPDLRLVPPDPDGVRSLWRRSLDRLERIGAACESDREGEAFFEAGGLRGLYGGSLDGVLDAARGAVGSAVRLGCAPGRFSAYAAALRARPRRSGSGGSGGSRGSRSQVRPLAARPVAVGHGGSVTVQAGAVRAFLDPLPVGLLRSRAGLEHLPELLERLGIRTLGQLSALSAAAVAERFGHPGLLARDLAQGRDTPLEPRRPAEPVVERLELPEAASGPQLERALELLVARVLSRPERRGRTLRAMGLAARFVEGGTWRTRATLRSASADAGRLQLVLAPKLAELPAPAESIALEVEGWGPPAQDQGRLIEDRSPAAVRRARIAEAVGQLRQAVGPEAALRVLAVDPDSRLPERRAVLAPYPVEDDPR